jgi:hypothetical protein
MKNSNIFGSDYQDQDTSMSAKLPTWDEAATDLHPVVARVNDAAEVLQAGGDAEAVPAFTGAANDVAGQVPLQKIRSGWSVTEVESWVQDEFLEPLAEQSLTTEQLSRYLGWLVVSLKAAGYQTKTVKQYQKIWKQLAQNKHAEKVQQKQVEAAEQKAAGQVPARFSVRTSTLPEAFDAQYLDPQTKRRLAISPCPSGERRPRCQCRVHGGRWPASKPGWAESVEQWQ